MKLELKHLAPYLPYNPKALNGYGDISDLKTEFIRYPKLYLNSNKIDNIALILRPLSDLFKLIDWDNNNEPYMIGYKYGIEKVKEEGIEFYASEYYAEYAESPKCYIDITAFDWWLFEYHFDVFGLIEKGEAIDINTL